MKESFGEGLATHTDPESCGAACKGGLEALTGARAGRVFSRERNSLRGADAVRRKRKAPRHEKGKPETFNFLGFTHICGEEAEQRTFHGASADDSQAIAGQAERGENRTQTTHARPDSCSGHVAALGCWRAYPLLRRAHEQPRAAHLSVPGRLSLASRAVAPSSERPRPLGPDAAAY